MGFVSNLMGAATGNKGGAGMNYQAGSADLITPVGVKDINDANKYANQSLAQQQALVSALQAQHGIQNQSNVFNQLQGVANGQGPNPAQAQLAQATGSNTANQAALMASQRGAGANVGLIGRQAANIGAQNQQQSAGQAATLQAQQSLGALNQLGNLASTQVGQQQQATGSATNARLAEQQNILNSVAQLNQARVGNVAAQNSANASVASHVADAQGNLLGGLMGGAGSALQTLGGSGAAAAPFLVAAKGGMVPHYDEGGTVSAPSDPLAPLNATLQQAQLRDPLAPINSMIAQDSNQTQPNQSGPQSFAGRFMQGFKDATSGSNPNQTPALASGMQSLLGGLAKLSKGGKVPAMVSPGEVYLPPEKVEEVKKGKDPIKEGQKIPGKAKLKGDNYANDTVPRTLDEGGIVIPKSVMESKHPHWEAFKFVQKTLAKK